MKYFVIEHRTRGVLMAFYWGYKATGMQQELTRFSWSKPRTDGIRFHTRQEADEALAKVAKLGVSKCYLVEFPGGKLYGPPENL